MSDLKDSVISTGSYAEEQELLDWLLAEEGLEPTEARRIAPRARADERPLSFAQQRLWFLDQWLPGSPAYALYTAINLTGRLDVAALNQSLNEIVRRHETLRTSFLTVQGRPAQIIEPALDLPLLVVDLRELAETSREAHATSLATTETRRPFDLGQGPLLRAVLMQLGEDRFWLLLTMHHIVTDRWSMGALFQELTTLYERFSAGRPSPLPELPIQYVDFAHWQRQEEQERVLEAQLDFWKRQLDGAPAVLELPTDRPRPAVQSFQGATQSLLLPDPLATALKTLSRSEGTTLFMTLLAAFKTLLHGYTGQTDIVVGSPVANRNRAEIEELIGFFVNMLVLRADLSGDPTFRQLLQQVREITLEAYAHQDLPFERLVDELQPERDLSHSPLFQTVFGLQTAPRLTVTLPGLTFSAVELRNKTAKYDLTLSMMETAQGLTAVAEYNTDLFDDPTILRTLEHYQRVLEAVVADPDRRLSDLSLLGEAEQHQLLREWNDAQTSFPSSPCVHQRVEAQAERTPDAVAVVFDGHQLTYEQLNCRVNQLAHYLQRLGVGPEVLVAMCLEPSLEMVIGILGILKAGGAYVPLDPAYPKERLGFMLEDTQAPVLLMQERLLDALPPHQARVVCLDADWNVISQESERSPISQVTADNLAYVIYTSGSTGKPKGVLVSHANVARLLEATDSWFHFNASDVWTLFHSYAFDFSVWELWGALAYGGRLVVVPYLVSRSPDAFVDVLFTERVTVLNQTPSAFRQLMAAEAALAATRELALRLVIFGGEALELQGLKPWFDRHGDACPQLINMYGITEGTVHVTYRPVTVADLDLASRSVVGEPIPDLQVNLLDRQLRPVPIGVPAEMHIGGAGLARGYLNRPELTAQRFIPNPVSEAPGARLYRSGDLARYLADGDIEFLGRIDHQVKIRGFRIELGEVEAVLDQHPGVQQAVVLAREDVPGDKRLVAYVVADRDPGPTINELRSYLKTRLPDYMVPAALVMLEALPLTPNGKVDRRALPAPGPVRPVFEQDYVAPRTPVEEVLAAIWAQVLGIERVGIHDNFFALGGDSILSIRVLALANERGMTLSLQDLFLHQTISELAKKLRMTEMRSAANLRTEAFSFISPEDRAKLPDQVEDAYPLAMLQAGMIYHMELAPESPVYHNINSWHLRARWDEAAFRQAVDYVVARHAVLRTSFDLTTYSQPLQLVYKKVVLPIQVEDLRQLSLDEQERVLAACLAREKDQRFDFSKPPLLRFHIHRRTDDTFQFTLTECHAILDGWSLTSTLAEIFKYYLALLDHQSLPKEPPPAVSYRDFVFLEQVALNSEECQQYWAQKLHDCTIMTVPRWLASPRNPDGRRFRERPITIPDNLFEGLKQLARLAAVPLKSVLLAAHVKVMSLLSGHRDVLTGLVANGRPEDVDGEQVRGLFLNSVPFRVTLADGTWTDLVRQTFEAELELLPFRRYPVNTVREHRGEQRLFETLFNYIHFHSVDEVLRSGGVDIVGRGGRSEENDLTLAVGFSLSPSSSQLTLMLEYDGTKLCDEQVRAIGNYFCNALQAMAGDPLGRHEDQSLLPASERYQLLVEWNDTEKVWASGPMGQEENGPPPTLSHWFEAQVERTPDAVAVIAEDEQLSYTRLNARANQVGHYLRRLGIGPETVVGLCLERSVAMAVGVLGILKAGGTYVPLDPLYPSERLALMLEDSAAPVVVTERRWAEKLPPTGAQVVCLSREWPQIEREPTENVDSDLTGDQPAYLMYTSGSTGRPKGVLGLHRGMINRFQWMWQRYPFEPGEVCCQKTSLSFGDSVWEIFGPMLQGVPVVYLADEVVKDPQRLVAALAEREVTRVVLVPSLLRALLESDEALGERLPRLKLWVCSGEALPVELWRRFQARLPGRVLLNLYGSSEVSADVTYYESGQDGCEEGSVPIGVPIANTQVYVLDQRQQVTPVGVAGEIYVGGQGLARGYWRRPELTAERFVPNPYGRELGARLYRMGDVGRHRPDGQIEHLGRVDHQVKIRGFRVEVGEIETHLRQHPAVRGAVVLAHEEASGNRSLVAYVVLDQALATTMNDLHRFLREKLPEYMVPSIFVPIEALPLTPSGKVDRQRLPAPHRSQPPLAGRSVAPRNPIEEVLAALWAEVLGLEQVGVEDNFFEVGGHSLSATQLVSRMRQAFQIDLPLRRLFESPTIAGLAALIEAARRSGSQGTPPPIDRVSGQEPLPLSFAQQRLWFLNQLMPGNAFYNIPGGLQLKGPLTVAALEQSLSEVVRRHEALRTTFAAVDGQPVQIVAPPQMLTVPIIDLRGLSESERESLTRRLAQEEAQRPFDLGRDVLLRSRLVCADEQEHVLFLTMHHIASDGWSLGVLVREMAALYEAFSGGTASPLPELPIQYADVAHWQRQWLQGEVIEDQVSYWRRRLADAPVLQLPTDRPRPTVLSFRGASQSFLFPEALSSALKALSRREGVTLFMTLLAAFQTLLSRYTGQDDIVVGSPIANRRRTEIEGLIGFFVNTLVLRTEVGDDPGFRQLLGRVREVTLGAYAHQDLPFEQLVELMQPDRDLGHTPLFQVVFVLQNAPMPALALSQLTLSPLAIDTRTAKFDLTLSLVETPSGLSGMLEYSTDLFDPPTINRLLSHFQTLLESIVVNPDQRLSALSLLAPPEPHQLLREWNDTQAAYPRDASIPQLFERQVEQTPDAVAVVAGDEHLTYGELNAQANRLAHHLQHLGVGPEVRVGICLERSAELIIGLLAIVKAGGVYVPLDPTYPEERLALMLEDAGVSVVVTHQRLLPQLGHPQSHVVCLDSDAPVIARQHAANPVAHIAAENLAYVMYTSGSTGRPKGIGVTHRAIARLVINTNYVRLRPDDNMGQVSNASFDAATFEVWGALLHGARLVVINKEVVLSPPLFAAQIRQQQISVMFLTAALFHEMARQVPWAFRPMRHLLAGGEAVEPRWVQEVLWHGPPARLLNGYGPTETTTFATCYQVPPQPVAPASIPIGRPIANTEVRVLDRQLQPVPVGVFGELYIGGDGLARGYHNDPARTAEKFVPDPFVGLRTADCGLRTEESEISDLKSETGKSAICHPPSAIGSRLYRTGDVVRYLPDGNIEFLGRLDHQVKVRGFRIELGEIEAGLIEHPAVRQAIVLTREDVAGDKRLVAYVVADGQPPVTVGELREYLKQKLPEYMVPAAFVLIDALPLTVNGKVDRQALLKMAGFQSGLDAAYVAPRSDLEQTIATIWQQTLRVEKVGVHDNFFDLGGNSLLATRVHSELQAVFNQEISLVDLFQYPTVALLAQYLSQHQTASLSYQDSRDRAETRKASAVQRRRVRQTRRGTNKQQEQGSEQRRQS
jgi:amino acid adenylation domain-containing protein